MNASIDDGARKQLALLARRLASGRVTNDDFEDALPSFREAALHDIYFYGLWPLYDDFIQHKLVGRWALTKDGKVFVARIVLFLHSDLPYRYQRITGVAAIPFMLLSMLTFGWFGRVWRRRQWANGDESVWPFFSRSEFEAVCQRPVFLSGDAVQEIFPANSPHVGNH